MKLLFRNQCARKYDIWVVLLILTVLGACATRPHTTNLTPARLLNPPIIETYQDPEADWKDRVTFSVFPLSLFLEDIKMNEIEEKQALFFLRNQFEKMGYRYVAPAENPDFLVSIDITSTYKDVYVPPKTVTVPKYVPETTVTTESLTSGSFNPIVGAFNTYGNFSTFGLGGYSERTTSTTTIPGYMTTEIHTRPGYTVGVHYPSANIYVYDGTTGKRIWFGIGTGTSKVSDPRISSQFLIKETLTKFPLSQALNTARRTENDEIGMEVGVFTKDGNNYFPAVLSVRKESPADKAGLAVHDMIVAIDGHAMVNKPYSEIAHALKGAPGTTVSLDILRLDQEFKLHLTRIAPQ